MNTSHRIWQRSRKLIYSFFIMSLLLSGWNLPVQAQRQVAEFSNPSVESCTAISLDSVVADSISTEGETDCFAIDGSVDDHWLIRILVTSGTDFSPYFELTDPIGSWVCSNYGGPSPWHDCSLNSSGIHFILINDPGGHTGNYSLKIQKTHELPTSSAIAFDQVRSGSISTTLDTNAYTFSATAGEYVYIRILDTGGTAYHPQFALYRPNGTWIDSCTYDPFCEMSGALDTTGTYTILVGDHDGDQTGNYSLYIQSTDNPVNSSAIPFDQTVSGNIATVLDTNAYTFSANADDRVLIRVLGTGGTDFNPTLHVFRPAGSWICSYFGEPNNLQYCTLDASGTYSILVGDDDGDQTGSYSLYIQRLNNPVNATPIGFDQVISGSISTVLDTNAYTFSATADDEVFFRVLATGGTGYVPQFSLYRPDGTWSGCANSMDLFSQGDCVLDSTGTYKILVGDYGGDQTGSYSFYLQRISDPVNATLIDFDQTVTGSITTLLDTHSHTFSGVAGDRVIIRILDTSVSAFNPEFHLYREDGSYVIGCSSTSPTFTEDECQLDDTGVYSILVNDYGGDQTGDYSLYIQRLNNPVNATPIDFDQTVSGSITTLLDTHSHTFSGVSGDRVIIRILDTSVSAFNPEFRLYREDGSYVSGCWSTAPTFTEDECQLDDTGVYSILVSDYGGDQTGNYSLYIQRLNDPVNATPIDFDQTVSGSITTLLDTHSHTFSGAACNNVLIRIQDTSVSAFHPEFRLYREDGSYVSGCWSTSDTFAEDECQLDDTGVHSILVNDYGGDQTGDYSLYIQCLNYRSHRAVLRSQPKYDGWIRESGEFSNKGGRKDKAGKTVQVGDDAADRQYRSILSFNTAGIPDTAVITKVIIKVKRIGVTGTDPMKTHNGLVVDIKKGKFYTLPALQIQDFQAKANKYKVGKFPNKLYSGWYKSVLNSIAFPYINKTGRTQFRIRFTLDDNDDNGADILKLYSGNAIKAKRPQLIVEYYVP